MNSNRDSVLGYFYAFLAFIAWGILPVYWKLLKAVPAWEILAHRIFWSFIFLFILLLIKQRHRIFGLLRSRKTRNTLLITSLLIGSNWGVYIYAVNTRQIVEASLGYYITPLINVALGMLVLHERLDKLKFIALLLAVAAVAYLTIDYGHFPWIALYLAFSFGFYGLLKKTSGIEAMPALAIETLMITPFAALFIVWKLFDGTGYLFAGDPVTNILLIVTGVVTSMPLFWFAMGAQRISLTSVGFMQYIAPTLMLLLGIIVYGESFRYEQSIAFGCIWVALVFYSVSMLKRKKQL